MAEKDIELFNEILSSDRLGAYQNWSSAVLNVVGDDPSYLWEQIKWNPWLAMAIYEDMEDKDSTLFSCLEKRRDGVLALPRRIVPASDKRQDKKIAEFIEDTLNNYWAGDTSSLDEDSNEIPFESFLAEALEAVGDGVTIGEIIFAAARDRIYISEVKFKPQHLFAFGATQVANYSTSLMTYAQTGKLCLRAGVMIENFGMGAELPEHKFFVFSYRSRKGNRWGSALKKKVFWQVWIKKAAAKGWLRYIDKGSGTVVARYNDGAAADEQKKASEAANAVQEESAVAIPKKFLLEVHEMVRNIGSSHKELVDDFCNAEISRAIVGQTLTGRGSDGGGSRALGEVHERVESKKVENDANALAAIINKRIIRPLVLMNFGANAKSPLFKFVCEPEEDTDNKAKRFAVIRKDIGLELSKKQVRGELELDEPIDEADTLGNQPQPTIDEPNNLLDAKTLEFAEKKTLNSDSKLKSKTERFTRLRPSTIRFSEK
jgi:phage gp29-like protein